MNVIQDQYDQYPTTLNTHSNVWTGDSYTTSGDGLVDVKDFLVTLMLVLGYGQVDVPSSELTESLIEGAIKLPKIALKSDGTHKTVKE